MHRKGSEKKAPEDCGAFDYVPVAAVKDWPAMSPQSAVAFKRHTGIKTGSGRLVRKGPRIFLVQESGFATCVYNHTREF